MYIRLHCTKLACYFRNKALSRNSELFTSLLFSPPMWLYFTKGFWSDLYGSISIQDLQNSAVHLFTSQGDDSTACVNKSASLKEHFFLRKLYVSFVKVYNNMIGNIISFYWIFVLCNLDLWFRNYGKSCKVPPNLFGLIHSYYCIHPAYSPLVTAWVSVLKINNSEQHNSCLTKVTVIIHVLIQFYMSYFDIR